MLKAASNTSNVVRPNFYSRLLQDRILGMKEEIEHKKQS